MKINPKVWSKLGTRAVFGLTMLEMAKKYDNLMVLTGDVAPSAGLSRFKEQFPNKFIDVGIMEQNIMNIAAGFASEGYKVVVATFAPFMTMRCLEQIRINCGYMNLPITMVGLASGLVLGQLGPSHTCIEDIGVLRSIPNMTILSPADCVETALAVEAAIEHDGPVYVRLTGGKNCPMVYNETHKFGIRKASYVELGTKPTNEEACVNTHIYFLVTGTVLSNVITVAKKLAAFHVEVTVVNFPTIKPLDTDILKEILERTEEGDMLIAVEEHNIIGGLGSAIAECIAKDCCNWPQFHQMGVQDAYNKVGSYEHLLDVNGLSVNAMLNSLLNDDKYDLGFFIADAGVEAYLREYGSE